VHATGGLADTITNVTEVTLADGTANGFSFHEYTTASLANALERATKTYANRPVWEQLIRTGMRQDWSWNHSAREFGRLYDATLSRRTIPSACNGWSLTELRTDWLIGRSVVIAENRAGRPNEFGNVSIGGLEEPSAATAGSIKSRQAADVGSPTSFECPFCRGQAHRTPPPVFELPDQRGEWQTRVVPNMYPAVMPFADASTGLIAPRAAGSLSQFAAPAIGVHEVIIESPAHLDRMSALSPPQLRVVLETYMTRLRDWRADGRFDYGLIFKNLGARAGASLSHLHSQFVALPSLPPVVDAELSRAAQHHRQNGTCPYCRLIEQEREAGQRMILEGGEFVAFCPFASLQPYEVWLMPTRHVPFFDDEHPDRLDRLAACCFDVIRRVELAVPEAAYNMLLRSAWGAGPLLNQHGQGDIGDWRHWRIEILPRATALAGFELASGMFINPLAPERAASKLRSI
jgi:UDPglucose--hexose-1-phosphate uridylyltransferase